MFSFKIRKQHTLCYTFGYVGNDIESDLCLIYVDSWKVSMIVDSRGIRQAIESDGIYIVPKETKMRPNVKARKNHTRDLGATIQPLTPYEMTQRGIEHYT